MEEIPETLPTVARQSGGKFAVGNPGGPGRPRRAVETEYLATLNEAVSLEDWREVVKRALADAKRGCSKARDWLSKHLLEGRNNPLLQLAVSDQRGKTVDKEIEKLALRQGDYGRFSRD